MKLRPPAHDSAVHDILRTIFGFEPFRPNQETIVGNTLVGKDVFAVMPTGGWKGI